MFGANTRGYVENGFSVVQVGRTMVAANVSSGAPVTVNLDIINPKNLDVTYSLSWPTNGWVGSPPAASPTPTSPTQLSFTFTPALAAEHHDLVFTLGKFVAATAKTYDPDTVTVHCDSPPSAVTNLTSAQSNASSAIAAFTLPTPTSPDDDLAWVEITYQDVENPASPGAPTTVKLGVNDASLTTPTSPDLLSAVTSSYKRYFAPAVTPGHAYAFAVTLIDAVGQRSPTLTTGAAGISYNLTYWLNDGTSTAISSATYAYDATVTIAAAPVRSGYTFMGWNTLAAPANGTGTSYAPGATVTMNQGNLDLYAQWQQNGSAAVTVSWGTSYGILTLTPATASVAAGAPFVIATSLTGTTSNWQWYVDGTLESAQSGSSFNKTWALAGTHVVSVTVVESGVTYSGSCTVTVTAPVTVSYLPNGATGGSVPIDTNTYTSGTSATVLGNSGPLSRPGYAFFNWNTSANGTGTSYMPGASVFLGTTGLVLYAQWVPVQNYQIPSATVPAGVNAAVSRTQFAYANGFLYVVTFNFGAGQSYVEKYDAVTGSYLASSGLLSGMMFSIAADSTYVYTTADSPNTLLVLDATTLAVVSTLSPGIGDNRGVVSDGSGNLYFGNRGNGGASSTGLLVGNFGSWPSVSTVSSSSLTMPVFSFQGVTLASGVLYFSENPAASRYISAVMTSGGAVSGWQDLNTGAFTAYQIGVYHNHLFAVENNGTVGQIVAYDLTAPTLPPTVLAQWPSTNAQALAIDPVDKRLFYSDDPSAGHILSLDLSAY